MRKTLLVGLCLSVLASAQAKRAVNFEEWTTPQGLHVYYLQANDIPMADISVAFGAGSARDGQHPGIATLTGSLLNQGTSTQNQQQIAVAFDQVGAQFAWEVEKDVATVSLRTLTDPSAYEPALKTFIDVISKPTFPEAEIKNQKNQQLVNILQEQQSPNVVASQRFLANLYGSHPYGHAGLGTADSVKAITAADFTTFYHRYYVAANAVLVIVGNLDKTQAEKVATAIASTLPQGKKAEPIPALTDKKSASLDAIPFPATQSNIIIGQLGIAYKNPDLMTLNVGNHILGGGSLFSRLITEVRVKRGLSYGVYSSFVPLESPGPFMVTLATRKEKAAQALSITADTVAAYIKQGPSEAELAAAKKYITGSFPLRLASNQDISNILITMGFYQLPNDHLDTYIARVNAVTSEKIRAAFLKYLNPQTMLTVQIGDSKPATAPPVPSKT
jgi:zinc protease